MNLIKCNNLTVNYSSSIPVLDGISFDIQKGMYLCIFGENGCGKSTLMKTILGLVPIKSGNIEKSKNISIGYLPQQTVVQKDFPISVFEVVLSGFVKKKGIKPFYSREMKKQALFELHRLKMDDYRKKSYRELSGGQQQRVLLARALCAGDDILFLDEPVTGLDPVATEEMYEIIKQLNDSGITIVMVTHDITSAMKYATHILHIENGKSAFFGSASDYKNSDVGKIYLK